MFINKIKNDDVKAILMNQIMTEQKFGSIFNPDSAVYEGDDMYASDLNIVLESYNKHRVPMDGEIWLAFYPFFDPQRRIKKRPVAIIKINGTLKAMYVSRFEEEKESKRKRAELPWNEILRNWDSSYERLNNRSIICGDSMRNIEDVKLIHPIGRLTQYDYELAMKCIKIFEKHRFSTPWSFLNWLIINKVMDTIPINGKNNNYNQLQSLEEVDKSKMANCVDISTCVHSISTSLSIDHSIAQTIFYNKNNRHISSGHVYTIFSYPPYKYVLFYIGDRENNIIIGDMHKYVNKEFNVVAEEEALFLRPHFIEMFGSGCSYRNLIIPKKDLEFWDNCVKSKEQQIKAIRYYFPYIK